MVGYSKGDTISRWEGELVNNKEKRHFHRLEIISSLIGMLQRLFGKDASGSLCGTTKAIF